MSKPGIITYIRDTVTYSLGVVILLKQGGVLFPPPESVSVELVALGALCCNVPGILQVIAWRSGRSSIESPPSPPEVQRSSQGP